MTGLEDIVQAVMAASPSGGNKRCACSKATCPSLNPT